MTSEKGSEGDTSQLDSPVSPAVSGTSSLERSLPDSTDQDRNTPRFTALRARPVATVFRAARRRIQAHLEESQRNKTPLEIIDLDGRSDEDEPLSVSAVPYSD